MAISRIQDIILYRSIAGALTTQLSGTSILFPTFSYSLSPSLKSLHSMYKSILSNTCSPGSYFHGHNINNADVEKRDYINITKYISFSSPVFAEVTSKTKQKPIQATPHPHENKMLFGPRVSENWLRIMILLKHLHQTETKTHGHEAPDKTRNVPHQIKAFSGPQGSKTFLEHIWGFLGIP